MLKVTIDEEERVPDGLPREIISVECTIHAIGTLFCNSLELVDKLKTPWRVDEVPRPSDAIGLRRRVQNIYVVAGKAFEAILADNGMSLDDFPVLVIHSDKKYVRPERDLPRSKFRDDVHTVNIANIPVTSVHSARYPMVQDMFRQWGSLVTFLERHHEPSRRCLMGYFCGEKQSMAPIDDPACRVKHRNSYSLPLMRRFFRELEVDRLDLFKRAAVEEVYNAYPELMPTRLYSHIMNLEPCRSFWDEAKKEWVVGEMSMNGQLVICVCTRPMIWSCTIKRPEYNQLVHVCEFCLEELDFAK